MSEQLQVPENLVTVSLPLKAAMTLQSYAKTHTASYGDLHEQLRRGIDAARPPKLEEPPGLGAVVVEDTGRVLVSVPAGKDIHEIVWRGPDVAGTPKRFTWDEIWPVVLKKAGWVPDA